MKAAIQAVDYYLPARVLSNTELSAMFPEWSAERIKAKTGITERRIAGPEECASDLAVEAARKLFVSAQVDPREIDFLLLCTQSPDHFLPTTACLVQHRLGLSITAGALDFNLGCSGYVYGLGLAKGLIETGQAQRVLLITAETYSKFIHPLDKSVRTLFGDAGAATLVRSVEWPEDKPGEPLGPFVFGTDGSGAGNLIVPAGGMRRPFVTNATEETDASGNVRTINHLYMNGAEIFNFTLKAVPQSVHALLRKARIGLLDVDLFVFHQANQYMLEHLQKKMRIPSERFIVAMEDCGNTVSSTIPIALRRAQDQAILRPGQLVMLVGFGVGYSWAATLVRWGGHARISS